MKTLILRVLRTTAFSTLAAGGLLFATTACHSPGHGHDHGQAAHADCCGTCGGEAGTAEKADCCGTCGGEAGKADKADCCGTCGGSE